VPRLEKFLFAEDARVEASGLLTLVGFNPTDNLLLQKSAPFQLPKLTIVLVLGYMEGIGNFTVQIEVSRGSEIIQRSPPTAQSRPPGPRYHTLVTALTPFTAPGPGHYLFKAILDVSGSTTSFSRKLIVEAQDQKPQAGN
jgi:hypothetical protein